jgi:predicted nuclease of predicted toxin-antitoxin system
MNLLLDECLDRHLAALLLGYYVRTVPQMGWASIKNGELLARAQEKFDVFLTVDRNLPSQQHLIKFDIAVLVIRTRSNRLADLKSFIPSILAVLPKIKKGHATFVGA